MDENYQSIVGFISEKSGLSVAEIERKIEAKQAKLSGLISKTGAAGIKDMGKVMGVASKELAGKADGKTISELVKELLS